MDPSDRPAAFRESIRGDRSRVQVFLVIAAASLVVGVGLLANLTGDGKGEAPSPLPTASAPAAAATTRPTLRPTPVPTPVPTLTPVAAPVTTAELSATGVLVADTGCSAIGDLVADVNGTIWTTRAGGVINVDPQTGRTHEWTLADDPAFAGAFLAAARQGGVWMVSPEAIRLFDGVRFQAVIKTPEPLWSVVEDADGALWAQTDRYGLIRWADGVWTSDPPGRPGRGAADIVVDAGGRVWTANFDDSRTGERFPRGISAWDGSAWTSFTSEELPDMPGGPSLLTSGDGSVWVAVDVRYLARFQAGYWTRYDVADLEGIESLSAVGGDGRLWFVREDCESCSVQVQVYDGSTLTTYDDEDGLPGADDVDWPGATVLLGPDYALASTEAGLYRLADGSWQRLEMSPSSGVPGPGSSPRHGVASLVAMSRDEVWAVGSTGDGGTDPPVSDGLFRFDGAAWHRERLPVETSVGQAVLAPDGALWVVTGSGPLVRRGDAWVDLGDTVARVVPEPGEVGEGCDGAVFIGGDGVAYYAGPRSGNRVVTLVPAGSSWEASLHAARPVGVECPETLVATADGTIWLLQRGWGNTLSRSAGGPWEEVSMPPADDPDAHVDPAAIVVDRDGSLWVVAITYDWTTDSSRTDVMQQVDGRWVRRGGGEGIEYIRALALRPNGSLIAVGDGIAAFDGQRWHRSLPDTGFDAVSVAPDGAVWIHDGTNVYRLPSSLP